MANVKASDFKVQQTLHGYNEGHRLLAGSATLPSRDHRTMLILSDASGAGAPLPVNGYLTGYPLPESAKYVLARTWPAPEITRPGCVWTHSILVGFSDLPALNSIASILSLFRRPDSGIRQAYSNELNVAGGALAETVTTETGVVEKLVATVYGQPGKKAFGGLDTGFDESLVLRLWIQQWPKLRRTFRFCTFTSVDRSTASNIFDLQLFPTADKASRLRIVDAEQAEGASFDPDFAPIVEDLLAPDDHEFRRFLRENGGDVGVGRGAMRPLCRIFNFLHLPHAASSANALDAVARLEELGSSQAVMARQSIARELARDIEKTDDLSFVFVLEHLRADPQGNEQIAGAVASDLWRRRPEVFANPLTYGASLAEAMTATLMSLSLNALVDGLAKAPSIAPAITRQRQDLLVAERFWQLEELNVPEVLETAQDLLPEDVVAQMLLTGRTEADATLKRFGVRAIIAAMESPRVRGSMGVGSKLHQDSLKPWLQVLSHQKNDLTQALLSRKLTFRPLLAVLASVTHPDAIEHDGGGDPWIDAIDRAFGSVSRTEADFMSTFLLTRGLGDRTPAAAHLMRHSIETVHRALADKYLPEGAWWLLVHRLPWVAPWNEWDRCRRVRQAVVERFVDRDLSPAIFAEMVEDLSLWRELAADALGLWRGRNYLSRVRDELSTANTEMRQKRISILDGLLR